VSSEPERRKLTPAQVALLRDVLVRADPEVVSTAERIVQGEPQPDDEVTAPVDELLASMLGTRGVDDEPSERGRQIDDLIGIVQQMSEGFYG
jgi:hypothetical protein